MVKHSNNLSTIADELFVFDHFLGLVLNRLILLFSHSERCGWFKIRTFNFYLWQRTTKNGNYNVEIYYFL